MWRNPIRVFSCGFLLDNLVCVSIRGILWSLDLFFLFNFFWLEVGLLGSLHIFSWWNLLLRIVVPAVVN